LFRVGSQSLCLRCAEAPERVWSLPSVKRGSCEGWEWKRRQIAVLVRRRRAELYARAIVPGRVETTEVGQIVSLCPRGGGSVGSSATEN
jgi:hypothetical protein